MCIRDSGRRGTPLMGAAAPSTDPLVGRVIDGRYRVLDRLGSGGMGTVYRVMHERMQKVMALKVLNPQLSADPVVRARFRREARAASLLESRNTVAVFDFGETPDGLLYLAMEYLRGRTLAHLLRERGTISAGRVTRVLTQVLRSLEEAHAQGIVHRDIKPDNIFLTDADEPDLVKVLDFGIAKGERISDQPVAGTQSGPTTRTDLVVGTPEYMSPEQARGQSVDGRADLWAVGVILYESLVGRLPFAGATAVDVLVALMEKPVPTPPEGAVPYPLWRILDMALKKRPDERFQSAAQMRDALVTAAAELGATPITATPTPIAISPGTLDSGELDVAGRDEWDNFARVERRKRQAILGSFGLLAAGAVVAIVGSVLPEGVRTTEEEPNNVASAANVVTPGTPLSGVLTPSAGGKADEDLFVMSIPPGAQVLSARVEPASGAQVNLGITVWVDGKVVHNGFGRTLPHPRIANLTVEGSRIHLRVREENPTTDVPPSPSPVAYTLTVEPTRTLAAGEEREPNNARDSAATLQPGQPINAWLSPPDDVDVYRVNLAEGEDETEVEIIPPAELGVEAEVSAADGKKVASKRGKPGERLVLKLQARRCGSPCVVQVEGAGKSAVSDPGYRILVR